ncbi:heterokaryon incompatibility protein [Stagonosporopsis vannaccii]|nr:heterokaryon incompatibility protein [Stagonosporopsis vannaccii]
MDAPYAPLDPARCQVRILELAPGTYDDDLSISLHVRSLRQKLPVYCALSYAWGHRLSSQKAVVGGKSMIIGFNLDYALRHIRCAIVEPILMWVDALCINQQDLDERSSQVLLMKDIYSSADRVLVYLGPEHPGDAAATACFRNDEVPKPEEEYFSLLDRIESICQRPWFGRVWIAQELALSQRDPTVYLGTITLPWSQFYNYVVKLERPPAFLDGHPRITAFMRIMYRMKRLGRVRASRTTSLNLQIYRSAPAQATDPRDKVFGLLGICAFTPNQMHVSPDYTKSTSRVFAEATISMLQEGENLPYGLLPLQPPRILHDGSLYQQLPDLPTWALDLNISSQAPELHGQNGPYWLIPTRAVHPGALLCHTNHIPDRVQVSDDFKCLRIVGLHLGTIDTTDSTTINSDGYMGFQKRATALRNIFNSFLKPRHITANSLLHALTIDRKTPVLDPKLSEQLPKVFEELLSSQEEIAFPSPFFDVLVALSGHEGCHLFLTDNDAVGITYHPDTTHGVRQGDEVVGLLGINFPFILRPVREKLGDNPVYKMINVAHVADHQWEHDFLQNAAADAQWSDFTKYGLKKYAIV